MYGMFSHAYAKIGNKMDAIFFLQLNECVEISCPWAQLDNYLITELENIRSNQRTNLTLGKREAKKQFSSKGHNETFHILY